MLLSIEFGRNIKIIEGYKKKDLFMISKAVTLNTAADIYHKGIPNTDLIAKAISEELLRNKIRAKKTVFIINSDMVITRTIKLPILDKKSETLSMILVELEQVIAADLSQYKVIYKIIETYDENGTSNALYVVYCLPYTIYKQYVHLAFMLKLKLLCIDVASNCLNKITEKKLSINNRNIDINIVNAFIDIDLNRVTFCTLKNGTNDFFRISPITNSIEIAAETQFPYMNSCDISDGMTMLLIEAINKCIRYYRAIDNNRIDKIYICGDKSNVWGLDKYLSLYLNIEVEIIKGIYGVVFQEKNELNKYFISVISLYNLKSMNFLSRNQDNNLVLITSITAIVVVFFCLFFLLFRNIDSLQGQIKTVSLFTNNEDNLKHNSIIESLKEETLLLRNRINNIEDTKRIINNEFVSSEILREIYYAIPVNTKLLSLSANRSSVNMQCKSESITDVILLLNNLKNIEFVEKLHIPEVQSEQGGYYSLSVICNLKDVKIVE